MSNDLVEDLRQEIAKGHVLVVVGSGVSMGATHGNPLASWTGLLEDGVERCVKVRGLDSKWADRVREEIRSGDMDDLLSAAEKISSKLGFPDGGEYRRWLRETIGGLRADDRSVLEALRDLDLSLATTNYDGLLEEVTGLPPVTWREGDRVSRAIRKDEPGILHLHGYWGDPESVVLGIRSYERILGHAHAQAVLRAVQTLHTLLFVGCGDGLSDPNFGALLEWARGVFQSSEDRHYRLCLDGEVDDLRKLHKDDHLQPVSYGSDHSKLAGFLHGLKAPASIGAATLPQPTATPSASRLPGKPRCFGRDDEVRDLVETLLQPSPPPTPILGGPGAGKTTITLEALYDRRVIERFGPRRFFVHCDGAASREALVGEIARVVGIEPGANPLASLFQAFEAGPAVLALDNAETPWEAATTAIEDLLSSLSSVEGLALVASIRGDQRPLGPPWRSSIRVGPMGLPAAREAFLAVAGESFRADPDLDRLLEAVDRLALALVLLAHEAEGEPNLASLWNRWQEKRTALLKHADGKKRLNNVEVSLDLSLNGPRMTSAARRLLSLLALLPDGVAHEDLDALMPGIAGEASAVLRKVGLAFDSAGRLWVLALVREYVRQHHLPEEVDLQRTIVYFLEIAATGKVLGRVGGAATLKKMVPELGNIEEMLQIASNRNHPYVINAALGIGKLAYYTGWGSISVLEDYISTSSSRADSDLRLNCLICLGNIAYYRSNHEKAASIFRESLDLARKTGDALKEGRCQRSLAEIAMARSEWNEAYFRVNEALDIAKKSQDTDQEAFCIEDLASIALKSRDFDSAQVNYEKALALFRCSAFVLGEANCLRGLAEVALGQMRYETAYDMYEKAIPLFRSVGDVLCEARCVQGIGDIALSRSDDDAAQSQYKTALLLYKRFKDPYSIGHAHVRLARLAPIGSEVYKHHLHAARLEWESIKRPDLVERLKEEFGEDF
jgi:tetratricopeptide (TPR) repeat protein